MYLTKKQKQERAERDAVWQANEDRMALQCWLFEELPDGTQKDALQMAMRDRIITLYNECRFEEGDAILEFLPNAFARKLLDWCFPDEDEQTPQPPPSYPRRGINDAQ